MSEPITAEERTVLEGCYRCVCSGCTRRRELIAKVLAAHDSAIDQTWSVGTRAEEAEDRVRELEAGAVLLTRELDEARKGWKDVTALSVATDNRLADATALLRQGVSALGEGPEELDAWQADGEAFLAGQPAALEFDDTVKRLQAVALSHGWVLKSWGMVRDQPAAVKP